jgi:hypothetical protein
MGVKTKCFLGIELKWYLGVKAPWRVGVIVGGFSNQCSETQLNYLKHWFRKDSATLKKLVADSCAQTPPGANRQYYFSKISLIKSSYVIKIEYWASGISLKRGNSWDWKETLVFKIGKEETLFLSKRFGKQLSSN